MSRKALVLLVCCCDFRDGAERLIPSKSLGNAVIRAFPGLFRILRMCAPRHAAAVVRPRERKKSADRRRRILISRLLIIRASVPRRKSPFPAYFKGFPAVSLLIPPYPAFLKYPVSPHFVSYLYFLIYELLSPFIEIFGVFTMVLAWWFDLINVPFMLLFFLIYAVFGSVLTLTAFFSRIYTADLTLSFGDGLKAVCLCLFELVFLRFILAWVRCTAFIGYRKKKLSWGRIERRKIDLK